MAQSTCSSSSETAQLLNINNSDEGSSHRQKSSVCPSLKHLCLPSKAAVLILFWTTSVGMLYYFFMSILLDTLLNKATLKALHSKLSILYNNPLAYAVLAVVMMFYPLSGFIADVCCGRMKTIVVSLIVFLSCNIFLLLGLSVIESVALHDEDLDHVSLLENQGILAIILIVIFIITFIIGLVGYQANIIQFGLDQLFEAPSQYLGLFIHYTTWDFKAGSLFFLITPIRCIDYKHMISILLTLQTILTLYVVVLLLFSYWKRSWFYSEPGRSNPYKTVYDIIKFVKNHKYPLRRSAFTYGDRYIPSRLDFAKERYGGPFSTEQVENVKTFFRILLVLFAVGPVFSMEVPGSIFLFPIISLHTLKHFVTFYISSPLCTLSSDTVWKIDIISGSILKNLISIIFLFPLYIWIVFSLLNKKIPKLFHRLGVGIVISLLGVVSLLIIDVVGHSVNKAAITNHTQCMFQVTFTENRTSLNYPTLNLHWSVLIPPNLLLGIGPLLVVATTFEFISAQSPQSMKGLLVGVFFAIRGLFQLLNSIIIIPLSLKQPWASEGMLEHPPVTNCGFVYLLLTCVSGLIGLILFSVAAKKYKYRRRDEGMFRQQDVEEIYDRYLPQPAVDDLSYEN